MTLSTAVAAEGFTLIIDPKPGIRPDRIGDAGPAAFAQLCEGNVIACVSDSWDWAYAVAHEIAEARTTQSHGDEMWSEQCNLMSRWIKGLAASLIEKQDTLTTLYGALDVAHIQAGAARHDFAAMQDRLCKTIRDMRTELVRRNEQTTTNQGAKL